MIPGLHHCYCPACPMEIPARLLLCAHHFSLVPGPIAARLWAAYTPRQCKPGAVPSVLWCLAADEAVEHVATLEGRVWRNSFARAYYPADPRNIGLQARQEAQR